jgi:tetratricopeptide (TPR) repeat protein
MEKLWYKNETWSEAIETSFLNQLENTEYGMQMAALKIQGDYLLHSKDVEIQQAGIRLLQMLLTRYPDEIYIVVTAQDILGEYYYKRGDFESAEIYLQSAADFYRKVKRIGVTFKADLLLAETILLRNLTDRLEEAWQLVIDFPGMGGSLSEDYEEHYYYELLAHLCYQLDRKTAAAGYAMKAIEIAQNMELDFMISKSDTMEKYYQQLPDLQQIADYESI